MTHDMVAVEVVASGTLTQIERWGRITPEGQDSVRGQAALRRAQATRRNHAEMWVDGYEVDRARSAIRGAPDADDSLIW